MRRLWAHIAIAAATLVAVFASFPSVLKGIASDGDYLTRRQFTFRLSERIDSESGQPVKSITDDSAKEIASEMEVRLKTAGVESYDITTSGSDIITATYYAETSDEYKNIATYLTFSGSFALMSADPDGEPLVDNEFLSSNAYLNRPSVNEYPTLFIPLKTDSEAFTNMLKYAQEHPDEEEAESSEEGEEASTVSVAHLYIIFNYEANDTYKSLTEREKLGEKLLLTIDVTTEKELDSIANDGSGSGYAKDKDGNYYFYQKSGYQDLNSNGTADANEVAAAYRQADYLVNLFNASSLDYEVKLIRGLTSGDEVREEAKIENLFAYGQASWTSTLTAVVAAIVIVTLLLVVFYRLGALSIVTTTLLSTFLTFLLMVTIGLEFNTIGLLGLIVVALGGLVSGIIYASKLKDECYRGRTLKKANLEASKKSTLPIIDIHVVTLLIGLFTYLLGGASLHTFGSVVLLGSLISVLISLFGLKGLFWLSTNTTKLAGKYEVFAIDSKKVPNHMLEEKQSFFGTYADKDFSKKKKPVGIVALALVGLSLAGLLTMGLVSGGNLFREHGSQEVGSEIFVVNTIEKLSSDSKETLSEDDLRTYLGEVKVLNSASDTATWDSSDKHATLLSHVKSIANYSVTETVVEDESKTYLHTYYQVSLDSIIKGDAYVMHKGDAAATIDNLFETLVDEDNRYSVASLKTITSGAQERTTSWSKVILATGVALVALSIYLFIRYRLSRPIAALIYPVASSIVTLGLLALLSLGLALPSAAFAVVPLVSIFSYFIAIIFANKERDLILDEKDKNMPLEKKLEISKKAFGMAYAPILVTGVITIYILINFFGFGPGAVSYLYLSCIIACLLSLGYFTVTYLPYSNFLLDRFSRIHLEPKPRKNKKNKVEKPKTAEPEESIFIGIND